MSDPLLAALSLRKASMRDVPALLRLINEYASKGIMLPRTEFEMAENMRDFTVACAGSELVGCGALHFYTPDHGEIRSLAVDATRQQQGTGKRLMEALETEAVSFGLESVFAFTYVPDFFRKLGYQEIERGGLPLKAWKDCLRCPKFQCCDEIAMVKPLAGVSRRAAATRPEGDPLAVRRTPDPLQVLHPGLPPH